MKPGNLASWAGIVPSIYQSAGAIRSGAITKKGNEHIRCLAEKIGEEEAIALIQQVRVIRLQIDTGKRESVS